jgi:hypothetical protein
MINFTRAFDSAWERMHVILFRPFDFGKWCAIGLSAFLAGFLQGGNGFNSFYNNSDNNRNFQHHTFWQAVPPGGLTHDVAHAVANVTDSPWRYLAGFNPQQLDLNLSGLNFPPLATGLFVFLSSLSVVFVVMIAVFVLALILLIYWLGARGQFLFIDNVVRNRGAISWPWTYYARQANSLFLFYLLFLLIMIVTIVPIVIVGALMAIPLFRHSSWPVGGEIAIFVILGLFYLAIIIVFSVILFVFREWGVPLMFRNGLMARDAFMTSMRLIMAYPGSIALFVLLRIAIFIGLVILSIIACCLTCCVALLPYIGTVILLPALVFVRCFSLDCLAQFGPEYDVWTVDVPPSGPAGIPTFTPQPPLG